jgi:hypothetical protein
MPTTTQPKSSSAKGKKALVAKGARTTAFSPSQRGASGGSARVVRRRDSILEKMRGPRSMGYFLVFLGIGLVIQGLHAMEHIAQSMQILVLGVPKPVAGGLLGSAVDFPVVHFVYNFAFFLFILWSVAWAYGLGGFQKLDRRAMWLLLVTAVVQTYHAAEHVIQISQEAAVGTQRPPGFIGLFQENFIAHLILNVAVWILPFYAFVRLGGLGVMKQWIFTREVRLPSSA